MFNLIKSDFYRIFKSRLFYICLGLDAIFSVLCNIVFLTPAKMHITWQVVLSYSAQVHMLIIPIFVCCYITSDFKNSVIKITSTKNHARAAIYFSKFLTSLGAILVMCLSALAVSGIVNLFASDDSTSPYRPMLQKSIPNAEIILSKIFLIYLAYIAIYTMISFLVRKGGISVAIATAVPILYAVVVSALQSFLNQEFFIEYIDKYTLPIPFKVVESSISGNNLEQLGFVALGYIILASVIGVWSFCRRDIK